MILQELFYRYTWAELHPVLIQLYPGAEGRPEFERQWRALIKAEPRSSGLQILIRRETDSNCVNPGVLGIRSGSAPVELTTCHFRFPRRLPGQSAEPVSDGVYFLDGLPLSQWAGSEVDLTSFSAGEELAGLAHSLVEMVVGQGAIAGESPGPPTVGEQVELFRKALAQARELAAMGEVDAALASLAKLREETWRTLGNDPLVTNQVAAAGARCAGELALQLKNERNDFDGAERAYGQALALNPEDATLCANAALLLTSVRGRHDEAEALYQKALRLAPQDANTLANYAFFRQNVRRDFRGAEKRYNMALRLNGLDANIHNNYAGLCLLQDRPAKSAEHNALAWTSQSGRHDRISARILWLRLVLNAGGGVSAPDGETLLGGLAGQAGSPAPAEGPAIQETDCTEAKDGDNLPREEAQWVVADNECLGRLKTLFTKGIVHAPWAIASLREYVQSRLPAEPVVFLLALSRAIDNRPALAALDAFPAWRDQPPISLSDQD